MHYLSNIFHMNVKYLSKMQRIIITPHTNKIDKRPPGPPAVLTVSGRSRLKEILNMDHMTVWPEFRVILQSLYFCWKNGLMGSIHDKQTFACYVEMCVMNTLSVFYVCFNRCDCSEHIIRHIEDIKRVTSRCKCTL